MTEQNFEDLIASRDVVLIEFWPGWHKPCRAFAITDENVSQQPPGYAFNEVDTEVAH